MANLFPTNGAATNGTAGVAGAFTVTARIFQIINAPFTVTVPIAQSIYTAIPDFSNALRWRARVVLAGEDISAKVLGSITVDAEEESARIADFSFIPDAGAIDPTDWTGAAVTIDYMVVQGAVVQYLRRVFTGIVDVPEYDPIKNVAKMNCTDDVQQFMDLRTRAQIDALTPTSFFNDRMSAGDDDGAEVQGFEYLEERMKTIPASFDLSATRQPRVTNWAAKTSPDWTFTAPDVRDESVAVLLTQAKDVINQIDICFQFRYVRLKERTRVGSWTFPGTFCDYLEDRRGLPNREMVLNALLGTGWRVKSVNFTDLDPDGAYSCPGGNFVFGAQPSVRSQIILGASWTLMRRYSQNIEEKYNISIKAPQSTLTLSPRIETRNAGFTADFDDSEWREDEDEDSILIGTQQVGGGAGDVVNDMLDEPGFTRDDANESLDYVIQEARVDLLANHRRNTVAFDTVLNPELDLVHTVRINTSRILAKGKVKALTHTMNVDSGEARTDVTLAISKGFGTTVFTESALTRPSVPNTVTPGTPNPFSGSTVGTQYGGKVASPAFNDTLDGYSGNFVPLEPGATNIYPERFAVDGEAVDGGDIDEVVGTVSTSYNIAIPSDELTITAP